MNIYFFTTKPSIEYTANISIISSLQKVPGAKIYSNLEGLANVPELPKQVDVLIVLGSGKSPDLAYTLALGIARNRPILFLVEKGVVVPENFLKISQSKDIKKIFTIAYFTYKNLGKIIKSFLEKSLTGLDYFNIKFTLRLNKSLDQYLDWKSKRLKKTKARLLRQIIEDYKESDVSYKR